jgi:hypothetical protein
MRLKIKNFKQARKEVLWRVSIPIEGRVHTSSSKHNYQSHHSQKELLMNKLFKLSTFLLLLGAWFSPSSSVNAISSGTSVGCDPIYKNVQFAKTRIGDLCLFRGNWICAADVHPNPDCISGIGDLELG